MKQHFRTAVPKHISVFCLNPIIQLNSYNVNSRAVKALIFLTHYFADIVGGLHREGEWNKAHEVMLVSQD